MSVIVCKKCNGFNRYRGSRPKRCTNCNAKLPASRSPKGTAAASAQRDISGTPSPQRGVSEF